MLDESSELSAKTNLRNQTKKTFIQDRSPGTGQSEREREITKMLKSPNLFVNRLRVTTRVL